MILISLFPLCHCHMHTYPLRKKNLPSHVWVIFSVSLHATFLWPDVFRVPGLFYTCDAPLQSSCDVRSSAPTHVMSTRLRFSQSVFPPRDICSYHFPLHEMPKHFTVTGRSTEGRQSVWAGPRCSLRTTHTHTACGIARFNVLTLLC